MQQVAAAMRPFAVSCAATGSRLEPFDSARFYSSGVDPGGARGAIAPQ